jgi:hypothetical protein
MLSARTLQMLRYLGDSGEVPLHVLIAAFWPDATPERARPAAEAWVRSQVLSGHVAKSVPRGDATTFRLTPSTARILEARVSATSVGHPRNRAHHAATLQFIEQVRAGLPKNQRIVEVLLEPEVRARVQAGRGTVRGQTYDAFPDALLVIEETVPNGTVSRRRVAVEYVTSKYTTKDIVDKARSFAEGYDRTLWVADRARTGQRVTALVGEACPCLT